MLGCKWLARNKELNLMLIILTCHLHSVIFKAKAGGRGTKAGGRGTTKAGGTKSKRRTTSSGLRSWQQLCAGASLFSSDQHQTSRGQPARVAIPHLPDNKSLLSWLDCQYPFQGSCLSVCDCTHCPWLVRVTQFDLALASSPPHTMFPSWVW